MKRKGNLYAKICSLENLYLADQKAQRGKSGQPGVIAHNENWEANLYSLHWQLVNKTYKTSPYTTFRVHEPKEREIFRLPYYPDRIVHHAIMNVLEEIFRACFTADTYSCIKGRGIHGALKAVKKAFRDEAGTRYYVKMDIRKFYPSIDHSILKNLLRRKFKDEDLLWLLEEIIDSAPGLPIGNYLSQYFGNFMLSGLDHWLKEKKGVKNHFRYLDDMVIFGPDKPSLHQLRAEIQQYLREKLRLEMKKNYRVAPVYPQGLDFLGYVCFHTHILMRKTIKKNFARLVARRPNVESIIRYWGWAKHCNSNNFIKTLLHEHLQGTRHHGCLSRLRRRQHQNRTPGRQRNFGLAPQGHRLNEKAWHAMPISSTGIRRHEKGAFHGCQSIAGSGGKGPGEGFSFLHNHREE